MKPLYVSDLDGTLMRSDKSISADSAEILNRLIGQGVCFTVATARTIRSASRIIRDIRFRLPVITLNGTVLSDAETERTVEAALFSPGEVSQLRRILHGHCASAVVKAFFGDELHRTYLRSADNPGFSAYLEEQGADPFLIGVETEDELFAGDVCYLSLIAPKEDLLPIRDKAAQAGSWEILFQKDTYLDNYWLEIFPKGSSKAEAMRKLMKRCGCDRLVVFGDSVNDLSGFRIADECYAVRNASDELKSAATAVLASNDEDAVARWLLTHAVPSPAGK